MNELECPFCGSRFDSLLDFKIHTEEESNLSYCVDCDSWYHPFEHHSCPIRVTENGITCVSCDNLFTSVTEAYNHPCIHHCRFCALPLTDDHNCLPQVGGRVEEKTHFDGAASEITIFPDQVIADVRLFMEAVRSTLRDIIITREYTHLDSRIFCEAVVEFEKEILDDNGQVSRIETIQHTIRLPPRSGVSEVSFDQYFQDLLRFMETDIDRFVKEKSGWRIRRFIQFNVNISRIPTLLGRGRVAIPTELKKAHWLASLKMDKDDGNCFRDAVLYSLAHQDGKFKTKRIHLISQLRAMNLNESYHLDFLDIEKKGLFKVKDILAFEKANNIIVRVYNHNTKAYKGVVYPNTQVVGKDTRIVHLMLLSNIEDDSKVDGHYFPITNVQQMVRHYYKQRCNVQCKNQVCELCLELFPKNISDLKMQEHLSQCRNDSSQFERMPTDPWIQFTDDSKMTQPMNVVYADIESLISHKDGDIHTAAYIGSFVKWHNHLDFMDTHEVAIDYGADCVQKFLERLESIMKFNMEHEALTRHRIIMTDEDELSFHKQTECERCNQLFKSGRDKHRDHDHITGKFCKTLCSKCNFRRKMTRRRLPVLFHNWKGYDSHQIILHGIAKLNVSQWSVEPLYLQADKTLSIKLTYYPDPTNRHELYQLIFLDSYQFLQGSLDALAKNLECTPISHSIMFKRYPQMSATDLFKKGIFPYRYFDDWSKMHEPALPSIDHFYNDLSEEACTESDYEFAQDMWHQVGCRTMHDYIVYYLTLDVCLLADVFDDFRVKIWQVSELEATHFLGIPGLTYSFCLKYCKLKLEALQDPAMYSMFEDGIRGGMTFVNIHHAKRELPSPENGSKYTHLMYVDANNLYGSALSGILPHSNFQWMTEEECLTITDDFMRQWDENQDRGFIVTVDLHYPEAVQDESMDLPFAPTPMVPKEEDWSDFMRSLWKKVKGEQPYRGATKLLLTHKDKERYTIHHAALKYYVEKGLQITKVHQGIFFHQEDFIKKYVEFHTQRRSQAKDKATKNVHKLCLNSLYGKTIEDVRKYTKTRFVRNKKLFLKYTHHPMCDSFFSIAKDAIVVNIRKSDVVLNKAIYIGQCVLDMSKIHMYKLCDQWRTNTLCDSVELIGGDTDSFFLKVVSSYPRDVIMQSVTKIPNSIDPFAQGIFDSSNYSTEHPLYSSVNQARLGCFKDETCGKVIDEFICLCAKCYSLVLVNEKGHEQQNRAKGVKRYKSKRLSHACYKKVYEKHITCKVEQTYLRSTHHIMRTTKMTKDALSILEDKRHWLDANQSVPYGYYKSKRSED